LAGFALILIGRFSSDRRGCAEITCVFEHLLRRATALPELIRTALADFRQSESRGS